VVPGVDSPLKIAINHIYSIRRSHKQNTFSIGFSALKLFKPGNKSLSVHAGGLDRKWNEVGSDQRFATYTALPAGKYTFRVEGATSRGHWDEPGATLRIEILPAWWNSWWLRVTYIAALLLVATAIYIYRTRQQKREEDVAIDTSGAGGSRAHRPGEHDRRADRLASTRNQAADFCGGNRRYNPLAMARSRSAQRGRGAGRGFKTHQRRNPSI
jgi:hypothetical protein